MDVPVDTHSAAIWASPNQTAAGDLQFIVMISHETENKILTLNLSFPPAWSVALRFHRLELRCAMTVAVGLSVDRSSSSSQQWQLCMTAGEQIRVSRM